MLQKWLGTIGTEKNRMEFYISVESKRIERRGRIKTRKIKKRKEKKREVLLSHKLNRCQGSSLFQHCERCQSTALTSDARKGMKAFCGIVYNS
jgi:hypothetical protein